MFFFNKNKSVLVAGRARLADSFWARLRGLLGSRPLNAGDGLYIVPCQAIHMFFMTFAIDAIFLDKKGTVVGMVENIQPGKISPVFGKAYGCLELPVGTIYSTDTEIGDQMEMGSVL